MITMNAMTALVGRRAVLDYARRPLNLVLLVAVPVVLVFVWGGTLADFSKLVGGTADQVQVEAATAGWAAAEARAVTAQTPRPPSMGRPDGPIRRRAAGPGR